MSLISWRQHLHWVLFIGTKTTIRYTFCILFLLEAKIPSICPQGLILYSPNALHSNYLNSGAIKWSNRAHFIFVLKKVKIIGFGYNDHFWRHIKIYFILPSIFSLIFVYIADHSITNSLILLQYIFPSEI